MGSEGLPKCKCFDALIGGDGIISWEKITYQADSILLDGENVTADDVAYETDLLTYDYDSLTEAYHANLGEWWNNISEVTCVTIDSNESFFGNQFFTADADTIWIYYEGVFFLAKSVNE